MTSMKNRGYTHVNPLVNDSPRFGPCKKSSCLYSRTSKQHKMVNSKLRNVAPNHFLNSKKTISSSNNDEKRDNTTDNTYFFVSHLYKI